MVMPDLDTILSALAIAFLLWLGNLPVKKWRKRKARRERAAEVVGPAVRELAALARDFICNSEEVVEGGWADCKRKRQRWMLESYNKARPIYDDHKYDLDDDVRVVCEEVFEAFKTMDQESAIRATDGKRRTELYHFFHQKSESLTRVVSENAR